MPRLSSERVREGLLHPDGDVRRTALHYFADAFWPDPAVMTTVIEAVRRYGRKDAFGYGFGAVHLAQTPETIRWAVDELRAEHETGDRFYESGVARLLVEADPDLLAPVAGEILAVPGLKSELAERVTRRVAYRSRSGDELWAELDALCRDNAALENGWEFPWDHGYDLVEALGRQGDRHAPRLMELLAVEAPEGDIAAFWREALGTRLAGELRHEPAIPLLIAKFEPDADILNEEAQRSLIRIGTDAAVAATLAAYREGWENRIFLGNVFGDVRSGAAVEAGLAAAVGEEDEGNKSFLVAGLVTQLSTEANDFARDYLQAGGDHFEVLSVLVPACALTGQDYPELTAWRKALAPPPPARRSFVSPEPPPLERRLAPITRDDTRVGRNDPCPCGSGKKYKKCCLPKAGAGPAAW